MGKISLEDDFITIALKMSEGNPGALTVLLDLFKYAKVIDPQAFMGGMYHILMLDDLNIYGSHIWIIFKYVCNQDLRSMVGIIRAFQVGFVTERQLKSAIEIEEGRRKSISGERLHHTLDVPHLVSLVEEELNQFQRAVEKVV